MTTTTIANSNICAGYEPITGYKLEQLIGRGGFGEVWRSEAPGGLHKAVKFVYGATDQHLAIRELRSLERIKGVHHPFLLTLERFGVVDERLVIVTELADGSLEDVYNRHRERGSCGIPRASLLSYLHDAADALDYLHSQYHLQHLDIKPGNLLLVGGHVKVGDFGLLKDLNDVDCSIVGGLTPVYAPPELFDGRPSLHSDQYSLAVMFQELLTGTRPFSGRTIAQLATQHVHNAPNLNPLPASDRPLIARALEKDPNRRYSNCCEFVDALRSASNRTSRMLVAGAASEHGDTLTGVAQGAAGAAMMPAIKDLPQMKLKASTGGVRITGHSLVVAVGGTGAKVLHELRERVAANTAACPIDLHSILIDTDLSTIHAAKFAEISDRVPICQAIHTPLKKPQEYRNYQGAKYKSISRRWLYNIPRSGATEGMRPLGRLALVDHGNEVLRQLEESIGHLSAVSGETTPKVYLVGSVDGGTGSGMVLDLVHLIRHVLDSFSLAHVPVLPLLITGPMQQDSRRPLAGSDAAATIAEMSYFLSPGNGYPGDAAANWPTVPSARTPLVDAYLIAAGLPNDTLPDPVDTVCEYIWADSTGAGEFLAAARQDASDESQAGSITSPKIRSVGMVKLRSPKTLEENLLAPSIVRQLLYKWLGSPTEAKELAPEFAAKMVRRCGFTKELFAKHCRGSWPLDGHKRLAKMRTTIDALPSQVRSDNVELQKSLQVIASETLGDSGSGVLSTSFAALTRELTIRLSDARCDYALVIEVLNQLESMMSTAAKECRAGQLGDECTNLSTDSTEAGSLASLADRWLRRLICCNAGEMFDQLVAIISGLRDQAIDQASKLAKCVSLVSLRLNGNDDEVWRYVDDGIRRRVGSVLETLRKQVGQTVVGESFLPINGSRTTSEQLLQSLIDDALPLIATALSWADDDGETIGEPQSINGRRGKLPADSDPQQAPSPVVSMTQSTVDEIHQVSQGNSTSVVLSDVGQSPTEPELANRRWDDTTVIATAIRAVRPALLACGGYQRLLLIVGSEPERERLESRIREIHKGPLTTTVIAGSAAMLICEAQQINLVDVQSRITTIASNDMDVMARLASRNDIDWKASTRGRI